MLRTSSSPRVKRADQRGFGLIEPLEKRLLLSSYSLSALASFNEADGSSPVGGVVMDKNGDLFGVTAAPGGSGNGAGSVFEIAKGSGTITTLASFSGFWPSSGLVIDAAGNLYGTAQAQGSSLSNGGAFYEIANGSHSVTWLASFGTVNNSTPVGNVLLDSHGNLYSAAVARSGGGGGVFELVKGAGTLTRLAWNAAAPTPNGGLAIDGNGNLFGTTTGGAIYQVTSASHTFTVLASFANGVTPISLVLDARGNLYGSADASATSLSQGGYFFEIVKGSHAITTLASFAKINDAAPQGNVLLDGNGDLFTAALWRGAANGAVFELPKGGSLTALASFNSTSGLAPTGLVIGSDGNLYGTATGGGANNDGTAFTADSTD